SRTSAIPESRPNANCSAFAQFFQLRDKGLRPPRLVSERSERFAAAVEHHHRWESLDSVLHQELFILLYDLRRHPLHPREIQLQEHEVLARVFLKFWFRKDFLVEHDAPAAPVRSGKVHQQKFVLRL